MDIARSFRYEFEDQHWINKIMIGVLLTLFAWLIIPALMLGGYGIAIIRQVMDGEDVGEQPLPQWENWGKLFKDGLSVGAAQIVYSLPLLLIMGVGMLATAGLGGAADSGSDFAAFGLATTWGFVACFGILFAIAMLFLTPAITIQYAIKDEFSACFRFGEIYDIIRDNFGDILITFLVTLGATFGLSMVIGFLGIIPILGWIAALVISLALGPYILMMSSHLYGQIAAKELENKTGKVLEV